VFLRRNEIDQDGPRQNEGRLGPTDKPRGASGQLQWRNGAKTLLHVSAQDEPAKTDSLIMNELAEPFTIHGVQVLAHETRMDDHLTLRFRVGQIDEELHTRGFTHLA